MRIKKKMVPTLSKIDLRNINEIIVDIYRELNNISKSAEEVSFRLNEKGQRELVIQDKDKQYKDVTGTAIFDIDNITSLKEKATTKIKENLSLDKVTNESKSIMFTNPSFTGDSKINTSDSNIIKLQYDNSANNTLVDVVTLLKSPIIRFLAGALPIWKIGFDTDDTINKFKIDRGAGDTLSDPSEFELDNSGNLVLTGTSTSSAGVCSGTTAASASASGIVELATTAETTSGTDTVRAVTPDGLQDGYQGSGNIVTTGTLNSGAISSGFGIINTGSSSITTTGNGSFGALTAGAVIWQSFPFYISSGTHSRYYYIDVDDTANSFRRWDDYDTSPTGFNYRDVAGQFVVPEDCTLKAMHGVIQNGSSTNNPTIYVYHGTVTEAASDTTLASAGSVVASITTLRVPYKFSKDDFDTDLSAGDIVVPMIRHTDTGGTRTFQGSLTLKFVTR
jgi:hypothetical protein|tara:strand:+ start:11879 stop:13225 length:1347 start_codon:yes stop_codon:yes gene_type:complete